MGHKLGMYHDFVDGAEHGRCNYLYRKYENEPEDCRGIMDYIDNGVGWSKCSASDFSRYITSSGTKAPCPWIILGNPK